MAQQKFSVFRFQLRRSETWTLMDDDSEQLAGVSLVMTVLQIPSPTEN